VYDDTKHFEFLLLETFQAGLSRYTVLAKRENFRKAFDNFDYHGIANYDDNKVQELMNNEGIIRNRLKILSAITNARIFMEIQKEYGSRNAFIWQYTDNQIIHNSISGSEDRRATSELSDRVSRDLKKRGMKFVGSTVIYAHLQATGQIDDHENGCWRKSNT
jgi:DNA-3-methyladenine glycosylase I